VHFLLTVESGGGRSTAAVEEEGAHTDGEGANIWDALVPYKEAMDSTFVLCPRGDMAFSYRVVCTVRIYTQHTLYPYTPYNTRCVCYDTMIPVPRGQLRNFHKNQTTSIRR
jgi:hypothetical protein